MKRSLADLTRPHVASHDDFTLSHCLDTIIPFAIKDQSKEQKKGHLGSTTRAKNSPFFYADEHLSF